MNKIEEKGFIINLIRSFFKKRGFVEVETPILVPHPDPACSNEVFQTIVNKKRAFLAPSPEIFMKKIIILKKIPKIFQICKAFRDSSYQSPLHNPEFTILEWYRTKASYVDLMVDCENLVNFIYKGLLEKIKNNKKIKIKNLIYYQDQKIDISPPWIRLSIKEIFEKYTEINFDDFLDYQKAKKIAQESGYKLEKNTTWEQIYHQIFLNEIEPKLPKDKPIILYDYPAHLAFMAKLKKEDLRYAERFEFYIGGLELGNGYSELTNWQEQERRLKEDVKQRKKLGMRIFDYDHEFIQALKKGLPKCAGIAVGIDRLVMLFTNSKTIQEVIPFPAREIFK